MNDFSPHEKEDTHRNPWTYKRGGHGIAHPRMKQWRKASNRSYRAKSRAFYSRKDPEDQLNESQTRYWSRWLSPCDTERRDWSPWTREKYPSSDYDGPLQNFVRIGGVIASFKHKQRKMVITDDDDLYTPYGYTERNILTESESDDEA